MKSYSALSVVLACGVLAGCASMEMQAPRSGGSQSDPCVGNHTALCEVIVTVTGCDAAQINADPVKVYVAKGASPVMQFKLSLASRTAGWRFVGGSGIVFKTEAGRREFRPQSQSPTIVTFSNNHSSPALTEYEYGITVGKVGGSGPGLQPICPQKDPWVVNL